MFLPFFIIDTFTSKRFRGNPTGLGILTESLDDSILLALAKEVNFPVTAFIQKFTDKENHYFIRYFTNTTEIPACGHATLAASGLIFEKENLNQTTFETIDGTSIQVRQEDGLIIMTYPKFELRSFDTQEKILHDLGVSDCLSMGYCVELETLFVEIDNPKLLKDIQPDYAALLGIQEEIKEIVVTSKSDISEYDFLLRSFCPWIGIDEDPVTGSVHAVLAGFWQQRLHKNRLKAYQCSTRGGELLVTPLADKVELGGEIVMVLRGNILI